MKSFRQFLNEETNNYEVGNSVKFDMTKTISYIEPDMLGGFDYGKIVAVKGDSYDIELPNNNVITVKSSDIISYGDSGATPE